MNPIKLIKPLIIFDLETTGLDMSEDRILEIYMLKVMPDGAELELEMLLNPGFNIPPSSTAIHGITDADVADKPSFIEKAQEIYDFCSGCDIGGYNSDRFDFPFLLEELERTSVVTNFSDVKFVDAQKIFFKQEPRTLAAAYKFYCNKEIDNAHSAKADTRATWEVLKSQVQKYEEIEPTVDAIHDYTGMNRQIDFGQRLVLNDNGEVVFNFGKNKGLVVQEVFIKNPGYYKWMMDSKFGSSTKSAITKEWLKTKELQ